MSNKPIADMIETIEHFAQTQPSYPVYNVLGQEHTYGDLKADSDSLAAVIDQLGLPEKSPVVVFGGQEYEMLATFVALTKSGHAYIPIDSHSAAGASFSYFRSSRAKLDYCHFSLSLGAGFYTNDKSSSGSRSLCPREQL